jgi:F0F1-type ATP synthase assembly protein I
MPPDDQLTPGEAKVKKVTFNTALALELPFTLVGAMAAGAAIGFFADRWLHTRPILMLILGTLGFIAGVREVIRRLPG